VGIVAFSASHEPDKEETHSDGWEETPALRYDGDSGPMCSAVIQRKVKNRRLAAAGYVVDRRCFDRLAPCASAL